MFTCFVKGREREMREKKRIDEKKKRIKKNPVTLKRWREKRLE